MIAAALTERPVTVTVYRRVDPPSASTVSSTLSRIATLDEDGFIDSYEEVTVPSRQAVGIDTERSLSTLEDLEAAAECLGVTLEPALQRINRHNEFTDETEEINVYPVVSVIVRDAANGSILAVAPVRMGDTLIRVDDLLDALSRT